MDETPNTSYLKQVIVHTQASGAVFCCDIYCTTQGDAYLAIQVDRV